MQDHCFLHNASITQKCLVLLDFYGAAFSHSQKRRLLHLICYFSDCEKPLSAASSSQVLELKSLQCLTTCWLLT